MSAVDEVVAVMDRAKREILGLRAENAEMLTALKSMRKTLQRLGGDPMPTLDDIIARAEARRAQS